MIRTIADFERMWTAEIESTQKVFQQLTDKSLTQEVAPGVRTLGRLAWHITTTIPEMMERTGLTLTGPAPNDPVPSTAKAILDAFTTASKSLLEQVKTKWMDATLEIADEMYGEKWKRGVTLNTLIQHQIHHRAQMTVVMRLAGLPVPGVFGPSHEEWAEYGMQPPSV